MKESPLSPSVLRTQKDARRRRIQNECSRQGDSGLRQTLVHYFRRSKTPSIPFGYSDILVFDGRAVTVETVLVTRQS